MTAYNDFDYQQSKDKLTLKFIDTLKLINRTVKVNISGDDLTLSIAPKTFAIMNNLPIFPVIVNANSKHNKQPNTKLSQEIFGTKSYKDVFKMYMNNEVTQDQYQKVLNNDNFNLLTSANGNNQSSNLFVCLDADTHTNVDGVKEVVNDKLMANFKSTLYDEGNTIITTTSQSGNKHIYGYASRLTNQKIKNCVYKNDDTMFGLDIKTTNNYVVISGTGYSDFTIESNLNSFLTNAKKAILDQSKRQGANSFFKSLEHDLTQRSDIDNVKFFIAMSAMMHVNVMNPQNFDSSVDTHLFMVKDNKADVDAEVKRLGKAANLAALSKTARKRRIKAQHKSKYCHFSLELQNKRKEKSAQGSQYEKKNAKSISYDGNKIIFRSTSLKHNKGKNNKVIRLATDNITNNKSGVFNYTQNHKTNDNDKIAYFDKDLATPIFKEVTELSAGYDAGCRNNSILNLASFMRMCHWTLNDAYDKLYKLDIANPNSLIKANNGDTREFSRTVTNGFNPKYRPNKNVLVNALGFNPYKFKNNTTKNKTIKEYRVRKDFKNLISMHNNSTVNAILEVLKQTMLSNGSSFIKGDFIKTTYEQLADEINKFQSNCSNKQTKGSLKKIFNEFILKVQEFTTWDLYAWFIYKATNNRQTKAEQDTDELKFIKTISTNIKQVYTNQDIFGHAIKFKSVKERNQNLLGRLTSFQILSLLLLKFETKRGRNGGLLVSVRDTALMPEFITLDAMHQDFESKLSYRKELLVQANSTAPARAARIKVISTNSNSEKQLSYKAHHNKRVAKKAYNQVSSIHCTQKQRLVVENGFKLLIQAMVKLDNVNSAEKEHKLNSVNRVSDTRSDLTRKGLIKALALHGP